MEKVEVNKGDKANKLDNRLAEYPAYITGSSNDRDMIKTKADQLNAGWTCRWFDHRIDDDDLFTPFRRLVNPIKDARFIILVLQTLDSMDDILFELGVMATTDIPVYLWYQNPSTVEFLEYYIDPLSIKAFDNWDDLVDHIHSNYDKIN